MLTAIGDVMRRVYERGWITTRDGNISMRKRDGKYLYITPSGWRKTIVHPEHVVRLEVVTDPATGQLVPRVRDGQQPSGELWMLRIPLNPATDSERIRPPLGAPRRRASVVCPQWPTSVCFGLPFAHGFSLERDLIGVVHEPVKNGVGQRRLADGRMPVIDRELTGYDSGPPSMPIVEEFQQIAAMLVS